MVPDYTTPALYRTKKSVLLRGAASSPPYISLAAPVFSHELPAYDLESDELGVEGGGRGQGVRELVPHSRRLLRYPAGCNLGSAVQCTLSRGVLG